MSAGHDECPRWDGRKVFEVSDRESMPYDVVIVGAGPAGLSAAIRLKQLANEAGSELSVCILEKGSEVGAHLGGHLERLARLELLQVARGVVGAVEHRRRGPDPREHLGVVGDRAGVQARDVERERVADLQQSKAKLIEQQAVIAAL